MSVALLMARTASTILSSMETKVSSTRAISSILQRTVLMKSKYIISDSCRIKESESISSEGIRPIWTETFSFQLTGEHDETLIFEIFRHNSCEGALQLDIFEIKLREEPMFLDLLSDQQFHYLQYNSIMMHPMMHQPSFESDNDSNDRPNRGQSSFKVMIRWRFDDQLIKFSQ